MAEVDTPQIADRIATRDWQLDLSAAGQVKSPKLRPANRRRQKIASYVGREGDIESFLIRQTIPYPGYEAFCPPSQAQYGAVMNFYLEACETRFQANTMLSARDFAEDVTRRFSFTVARKRFIWICTAAYILSDSDLRSLARTWNISNQGLTAASSRGAYLKCYNKVAKFASKLVDDMRGAGSEIFG